MWADLRDLKAAGVAERSAQGRWAYGRFEPACLEYSRSEWRADITRQGRGARKDARVLRRLLRRYRAGLLWTWGLSPVKAGWRPSMRQGWGRP